MSRCKVPSDSSSVADMSHKLASEYVQTSRPSKANPRINTERLGTAESLEEMRRVPHGKSTHCSRVNHQHISQHTSSKNSQDAKQCQTHADLGRMQALTVEAHPQYRADRQVRVFAPGHAWRQRTVSSNLRKSWQQAARLDQEGLKVSRQS